MNREILEALLFDLLAGKYVQRADARQITMGLQYTEAETHDLARVIVTYLLSDSFERDSGGFLITHGSDVDGG